eukprot:8475741-Alexandrium_andersonii.AAC.1
MANNRGERVHPCLMPDPWSSHSLNSESISTRKDGEARRQVIRRTAWGGTPYLMRALGTASG